MPAYYVAQINVTDPQKYAEVQRRFPAVFQKYKARVLAADPDFQVLDGTFEASRVVILEFETAEELKRWYYSDEYQETVKLRREASNTNVVMVRGI